MIKELKEIKEALLEQTKANGELLKEMKHITSNMRIKN